MKERGAEIRSCHPAAFRSGEWGRITGSNPECGCYQITWPDGVTDDWAIVDPDARYEFRWAS